MSISNKQSSFFFVIGVIVILLLNAGCSNRSYPNVTESKDKQVTESHVDKTYADLLQLNSLTEQFYNASSKGNRQLAYPILGRVEKASSLPSVRLYGTRQGWMAFDKTLSQVKKVITQNGSSSEWYLQAARIKLASDALVRPEAALWLQYEDILGDDESRMRQAWQSQLADHSDATLVSLHIFSEHMERFEIAALMQRDASLLQGLHNQVVFTEQLLREIGNKNATLSIPEAFQNLALARDHLFQPDSIPSVVMKQTEPRMMMPDQLSGREQRTVLYIFAIVMGVLSFVGWRRFVYERKYGTTYSTPNRFKRK